MLKKFHRNYWISIPSYLMIVIFLGVNLWFNLTLFYLNSKYVFPPRVAPYQIIKDSKNNNLYWIKNNSDHNDDYYLNLDPLKSFNHLVIIPFQTKITKPQTLQLDDDEFTEMIVKINRDRYFLDYDSQTQRIIKTPLWKYSFFLDLFYQVDKSFLMTYRPAHTLIYLTFGFYFSYLLIYFFIKLIKKG